MTDTTPIPQPILHTLFRALVHCGNEITPEQQEQAWAYLEARNPHEWFGYEGPEQGAPTCSCCGRHFAPRDTGHPKSLDDYCPDCRLQRCDAFPTSHAEATR